MADIVERLRNVAVLEWCEPMCVEAADEIERLRAERDRLRETLDVVMNSHGEQLHDAFAVARAALGEGRA